LRIVDALDEAAAAFYAAYGLMRLPDSLRLVRPRRLAADRTLSTPSESALIPLDQKWPVPSAPASAFMPIWQV
jgi:hypothetical protein